LSTCIKYLNVVIWLIVSLKKDYFVSTYQHKLFYNSSIILLKDRQLSV